MARLAVRGPRRRRRSRASTARRIRPAPNPPLYYALQAAPYYAASGGTVLDQLYLMRLCSLLFLLVTVCAAWLLIGELPEAPAAAVRRRGGGRPPADGGVRHGLREPRRPAVRGHGDSALARRARARSAASRPRTAPRSARRLRSRSSRRPPPTRSCRRCSGARGRHRAAGRRGGAAPRARVAAAVALAGAGARMGRLCAAVRPPRRQSGRRGRRLHRLRATRGRWAICGSSTCPSCQSGAALPETFPDLPAYDYFLQGGWAKFGWLEITFPGPVYIFLGLVTAAIFAGGFVVAGGGDCAARSLCWRSWRSSRSVSWAACTPRSTGSSPTKRCRSCRVGTCFPSCRCSDFQRRRRSRCFRSGRRPHGSGVVDRGVGRPPDPLAGDRGGEVLCVGPSRLFGPALAACGSCSPSSPARTKRDVRSRCLSAREGRWPRSGRPHRLPAPADRAGGLRERSSSRLGRAERAPRCDRRAPARDGAPLRAQLGSPAGRGGPRTQLDLGQDGAVRRRASSCA